MYVSAGFCFAPFGKGGLRGFALDLASKQEQIPLNPPFSKGGGNNGRGKAKESLPTNGIE